MNIIDDIKSLNGDAQADLKGPYRNTGVAWNAKRDVRIVKAFNEMWKMLEYYGNEEHYGTVRVLAGHSMTEISLDAGTKARLLLHDLKQDK